MRIRFLITNPLNEYTIYLFDTRDEATDFALALNREDDGHPSVKLFEVAGAQVARYVGTLWREFGFDFDPADCWRRNSS